MPAVVMPDEDEVHDHGPTAVGVGPWEGVRWALMAVITLAAERALKWRIGAPRTNRLKQVPRNDALATVTSIVLRMLSPHPAHRNGLFL